jgi:ATP-dependent DNA helicase RecG
LAAFTGDKIIDLLHHLPSNLIDRQYRPPLHLVEDGRIATFEVEVVKHEAPKRRNLPYRILCQNDTGYLSLVFFHARGDWLGKAMPEGAVRMVSGRVERFRDNLQIVHPDHMLAKAAFEALPVIEPVYPLTAGLSAKVLMKAIQAALPALPDLPEWQDADWLAKQGWQSWRAAIMQAHRPEKNDALDAHHPARARLAYDELLAHQLVLALVRRQRKQVAGRAFRRKAILPDTSCCRFCPSRSPDRRKARLPIFAPIWPRRRACCACCKAMSAAAKPWLRSWPCCRPWIMARKRR